MATAMHDSNLGFSFVPLPGGATGGPDLLPHDPLPSLPAAGDLPILDLNSTDPLPEDLPGLGSSLIDSQPTGPTPNGSVCPAAEPPSGTSPSGLWFHGDALMCACPECNAPMSIRTWLMIADCWNCTTSIELSETQEREAMRMMRQREQRQNGSERKASQGQPSKATPQSRRAKSQSPVQRQQPRAKTNSSHTQKAAAVAATATASPTARTGEPEAPPVSPHQTPTPKSRQGTGEGSSPSSVPSEQTRVRPRDRTNPRRRPASSQPIGTRAKIRKMAATGGVSVWVHDFFRSMPAWVISMIFHMVVITLLALLMLDDEQYEPEILLLTEISPVEVKDGGDTDATLTDKVEFDRQQPEDNPNENAEQRRARIAAEQDARSLTISPDAPAPQLPSVERAKELVHSDNAVRRTFAARDPRLRSEIVEAEGGTTMTEAAVARALRYLSTQQRADGGWKVFGRDSDTAGTALALLPFLGAGQTHQTGIYKENVSHGLRWLIEHQKENGDLRHTLEGETAGMYAHGQGAIVLCEAFALTGDEQLREPAQKAIDFIVDAQHVGGGWRYRPKVEPGDTSVVGWQLMALQSARVSGLDVPDTTLELADQFLDTVQSDRGAKYGYIRGRGPTDAMTAEGLLCRVYLGWTKRNPQLEDGLDWLMDEHMPRGGAQNLYYWYYGTQLAHHMGGPQWERWNTRMRELLVNSQQKSGLTLAVGNQRTTMANEAEESTPQAWRHARWKSTTGMPPCSGRSSLRSKGRSRQGKFQSVRPPR